MSVAEREKISLDLNVTVKAEERDAHCDHVHSVYLVIVDPIPAKSTQLSADEVMEREQDRTAGL